LGEFGPAILKDVRKGLAVLGERAGATVYYHGGRSFQIIREEGDKRLEGGIRPWRVC